MVELILIIIILALLVSFMYMVVENLQGEYYSKIDYILLGVTLSIIISLSYMCYLVYFKGGFKCD
jgi:hypothetical protein